MLLLKSQRFKVITNLPRPPIKKSLASLRKPAMRSFINFLKMNIVSARTWHLFFRLTIRGFLDAKTYIFHLIQFKFCSTLIRVRSDHIIFESWIANFLSDIMFYDSPVFTVAIRLSRRRDTRGVEILILRLQSLHYRHLLRWLRTFL